MSDIVRFKLTNGENFAVYRQALEQYPNSFLSKLIAHDTNETFHSRGIDNAFMIDEDSKIFASILTFYRYGILTIDNEQLRQAIIDKYMLPQVYTASNDQTTTDTDAPVYIYIALEHPTSSSTQTKPIPLKIPALEHFPAPLSHNGAYRSTDPIEIADYLSHHGYMIEQMDLNTHSILMKRKKYKL